MLAQHNGLAIITEKLQNQRLEETAQPAACLGPGHPARMPVGYDSTTKTCCQHQTNLAVKGKNVWALTVESERPSCRPGGHDLQLTPRPPTLAPLVLPVAAPPGGGGLLAPPPCCRHKKLRNACQLCDSAPGTPTAPPKKKHCRSLSVPPDSSSSGGGGGGGGGGFSLAAAGLLHHPTATSLLTPSATTLFPSATTGLLPHTAATGLLSHAAGSASTSIREASRLWKPIAMIPLSGSSREGGAGGGSGGHDNSHATTASSSSTTSSTSTSTLPALPHHHHSQTTTTDHCSSGGLRLLPSASAGSSSDSGHFTDHLHTPPGSPLPPAVAGTAGGGAGGVTLTSGGTRPASAASDTGSTSSCFSSLGSPWLDCSSSQQTTTTTGNNNNNNNSGGGVGGSGSSNNNNSSSSSRAFRQHSGVRTLQNRSLSCEDRISGSSSSTSSSPYTAGGYGGYYYGGAVGSTGSGTAASMPCVHAGVTDACCPIASSSSSSSSSRCRSGSQDGTLAACTGVGGGGAGIPRCHSQPCVLHHRRCGKKRRRNCDRPTLNFNKMTETAYLRANRRSEPWSTPVFIQQQSSVAGHHHHHHSQQLDGSASTSTAGAGSRLSFVLNPIASSPLDSDFPLPDPAALASRDLDLGQAALVALPLTPPDQASLSFPAGLPGRRGREEGDDDDDDDEEEEEVDHRNCRCHDTRTDDGVGLVFPMIDLDLEQIENH